MNALFFVLKIIFFTGKEKKPLSLHLFRRVGELDSGAAQVQSLAGLRDDNLLLFHLFLHRSDFDVDLLDHLLRIDLLVHRFVGLSVNLVHWSGQLASLIKKSICYSFDITIGIAQHACDCCFL